MALFGGGWQDRLATIGATLSDVGGALNHTGGGNLQALQMQRKADEREAARKTALAGLYGGMTPATQAPNTGPAPQLDWQALMRASEAGVDITPYLKIYQAQQPEYQGFNGSNGITVFDPRSGRTRFEASPQGPNADLERQLLEAQIAAARAQADVRTNQGDFYAAKARQPYAPPRKASGGSQGHSLPAGFKVVP